MLRGICCTRKSAASLRQSIEAHFAERQLPISLKYLDPSYFIRSVPANVYDRFLCDQMARNAVHAAMAGKTGVMVGQQHGQYVNVPIPAVVSQTKGMEISGELGAPSCSQHDNRDGDSRPATKFPPALR